MKKYPAETFDMAKMLLVVIAVAFVLSTSVSCFILNEVIQRHDEEMIKVIASDVYDKINNELLKLVMVSRTMANDSLLKQNLENESAFPLKEEIYLITDYLGEMKNNFGFSAAFIVSEGSKNYYTAGGFVKKLDEENNENDIWYKNFIARNVDYAFTVGADEANKMRLTIFANTRIKDDAGNTLGACGIGIDMTSLQKIFEANERVYGIKINLVNKSGIVQVDTESGKISKYMMMSVLSHRTNSSQPVLKKINGGTYVVTRYIPEFDWYLVISRDDENINTDFSNLIFYISVSFLIALIFLLIFIRVSLKRGQREIEESAKKYGIASHAGRYVSMHLIDLENDTVHELSRAPNVNLMTIKDGKDAAAQIKKSVAEMTSAESLPALLEFIRFENLSGRMKNKFVIQQEFLSAQYGWCKAYIMLVDNNDAGAIHQIVFAIELIDEEKRREKHLLYLSETDAMTGLRNRGSGEQTITDLMAGGVEGMFCVLDADKFKSVNDNFGHEVGDKVIKAIADCLRKTFRQSDVILRLGGDEFAAYAIGITDEERGKIVVDRFFKEIDAINIPELGDRKISISLGSALFSVAEGCSFTELYKRADAAAYQSKKTQGNCHTAHKK